MAAVNFLTDELAATTLNLPTVASRIQSERTKSCLLNACHRHAGQMLSSTRQRICSMLRLQQKHPRSTTGRALCAGRRTAKCASGAATPSAVALVWSGCRFVRQDTACARTAPSVRKRSTAGLSWVTTWQRSPPIEQVRTKRLWWSRGAVVPSRAEGRDLAFEHTHAGPGHLT